jgi:hypothetical protein
MMFSFATLVMTVIVVGLLLWFTNHYVPMEDESKDILNIVVLAEMALWAAVVLGVLGHGAGIELARF